MLTLLPLSGIQDVFRRRNSTTMDQFTDRRGSISVYDTYSLPSSKADMRRFSSYEQLAPFFQQILSQEGAVGRVPASPAPAPVPTSPSTASTSSMSPTVPSPLVRSRRGSIGRFASALTGSFRKPKSAAAAARAVVSESEADVSCEDLDAKLAEIKGKLVSVKRDRRYPSFSTRTPLPRYITRYCFLMKVYNFIFHVFFDRLSSNLKIWTFLREWMISPAQSKTSMSALQNAGPLSGRKIASSVNSTRRR